MADALRESEDRFRRVHDNLILGQEAERKRVARELHDDIGQRVALAAMALSEVESLVPAASPVLREKLQAVRRDVDRLATDIHRLSHNLHPATITQLGLVASLKQLCREVSEQTHIAVECECGAISSPMSEEVAVALFRVCQECLANVAKHSRSRDARVSLSEHGSEVRLAVTDRGVGFDVSGIHANTGLGLISIRERARMVGAGLEIQSTPSSGTTVELRVPISPAAV